MGNLRAILEYVLTIYLYLASTEFSCTPRTVHGVPLFCPVLCVHYLSKSCLHALLPRVFTIYQIRPKVPIAVFLPCCHLTVVVKALS